MRVCDYPDCGRKHAGRGLCQSHLAQLRRGTELRPVKPHDRRRTDPCGFAGCPRPYWSSGYCRGHARQLYEQGAVSELRPYGVGHIDKNGYRQVFYPRHPNARKNGYVMEHTVVMTEHLGRPLVLGESVHHLNGVRDDNRLINLELWVTSQPSGQRPEDLVSWAREILTRYEAQFG